MLIEYIVISSSVLALITSLFLVGAGILLLARGVLSYVVTYLIAPIHRVPYVGNMRLGAGLSSLGFALLAILSRIPLSLQELSTHPYAFNALLYTGCAAFALVAIGSLWMITAIITGKRKSMARTVLYSGVIATTGVGVLYLGML